MSAPQRGGVKQGVTFWVTWFIAPKYTANSHNILVEPAETGMFHEACCKDVTGGM